MARSIARQLEWVQASTRPAKAKRVELDRDEHGRLIIWRANRLPALIWLATVRPWQLGIVRDHPITGADLGLALELADRMIADDPGLSMPSVELLANLRYIENAALNWINEWHSKNKETR